MRPPLKRRFLHACGLLFLAVFGAANEGESARKIHPALRVREARAPRAMGALGAGAGVAQGVENVFLRLKPGATPEALAAAIPGLQVRSTLGRFLTAVAPLAALDALENSPLVEAVGGARLGRPKLNLVRSETTNAGPVYLGIFKDAVSGFGADGTNVIVGVIDTGINYFHEDFRLPGDVSRILSIWDQTDGGGPTPPGFGYGSYWTKAQIEAELPSGPPFGTVRQQDTNGHGTHVAGIAAGNGRASNGNVNEPAGTYVGVAPGADIIAVKTSFIDTEVCDAMNYVVQRAAAVSKRAVINLSLGFSFGSHDGQDDLDVCVDAITALNVPVFVAAGNEAQEHTHASHDNSGATEVHSFDVTHWDGTSLGTNRIIEVELWNPSADGYNVSVSLIGYSGSVNTTNGNYNFGSISTAYIDNYAANFQGGGRDITYIYVNTGASVDPSAIRITMTRAASGGSGRVDGYVDSNARFTNDVEVAGSIGVPATANTAIAVGAYATKNCWVDMNNINECWVPLNTIGAIAPFSSRGPTRDGRQKPDISGPGTAIASAMSTDVSPSQATAYPEYVLRDARHIILQGTSMATPAAAGWGALALQTFTTMSAAAVKTRVMSDARLDGASTAGNTWGAGKLTVELKPKTAPASTTATTTSQTQLTYTWAAVSDATAYDAYDGISQTTLVQAGVTSPYVYNTTANQLKGLLIRGRNQAGSGAGTLTSFVATYAQTYPGAGQGAPTIIPHITSMTVTYSGCGSLTGGCNGFEVQAAANAAFTGTVYYSSTTNAATLTQRIFGLTAAAQYYVRVANLNQLGTPSFSVAYGPFTQNNAILQPDPAAFSGVSPTQIQLNWSSGGNAFGTNYRARAFSDAGRTVQVGADGGGLNVFSALFSPLSPGTTYWFRVIPEQGVLTGPPLDSGPQATLAAAPLAAATPLAAGGATSVTATWLANGNGGAAVYILEVSASPAFASGVTTVRTYGLTSPVAGLNPNTVYYARVRADSYEGTPSSWVSLGSVRTLATPPTPLYFYEPSRYGVRAAFDNGGNGSGATFRVEISRAAGFNLSDDQEFNVGDSLTAGFEGLVPSTQYFFHAAAYNSDGALTAYSAAISTFTLPAPPGVAATAALNQTQTGMRVAWAAGLNPAGQTYEAEIHGSSDYSDPSIGIFVGAALFADFVGILSPNTVYYARVRTLGQGGQPPSDWTAIAPASTLSPPLGAAATQVNVRYTYATYSWTPLPAAPQTSTCEGYKIEASTDALFNGTLYAATINDKAATGGVLTGLPPNTPLFFRVGPINWNGVSNPTGAGGGTTLNQNAVTAAVTGSGAALTIVPVLPPVARASLSVPPGAFAQGTNVVLNTSVEFDMPGPVSNQARLTAAGAAAGVEITAQGQQPAVPVRLTLEYNPASLPVGMDARTLQVARYDAYAGQWTLIPTQVVPAQNTVVATLDHFSLFGLFGITPANALDSVQVFPVPWELNSRDPRFSANALTISNVPAGARVRIFNISGELVWDGSAAVNGVLNWTGGNRYGMKAGSGTYLVVIEGGGARVTRRAVLVR